jgi:Ferredoxin-like domain in Api92-like protein
VTTFCSNRLTVTGPGDVLESFVARVRTDEQPLSFETITPTPQEFLKSGWYEWRIEHWGTKWDAEFEDVGEPLRIRRTRATYVFLTAWSPPIEWLRLASEAYPELIFRLDYADQDELYSGVHEVRNGEILGKTRDPPKEGRARREGGPPYGVHSPTEPA